MFSHQRVGVMWLYLRQKGLLADLPGVGKAQPLSAKVLTPSGWRAMGDLAPGDAVLTPSGEHVKVREVFPQGEKPVYRVTLTDGSQTRATGDHLWQVETRFTTKVRSTEELLAEGLTFPAEKCRAKFRLPKVRVDDPAAPTDLPVDPYVLGALLGDGCFRPERVLFSSADSELVDALRERLRGARLTKIKGKYDYVLAQGGPGERRNHVVAYLREAGLMGVGSYGKFVPDLYKHAALASRVELLRGLMDTDGHAGDHASEFCSVSRQLAQDVADLVRSLGGYATIRPKETSWRHNGEARTGEAFRVIVSMKDVNPFRLGRKAARWRPGQRDRRIASITPDGVEESQCLLLDSEEHLYVTDDYVVTHNTSQALGLAALLRERGEFDGRMLVICQTPAVLQWLAEAQRWVPGIRSEAIVAGMSKRERVGVYVRDWEILIVGWHMVLKDLALLERLEAETLIVDDVDPLLHHDTKCHANIVALSKFATRSIVMNATAIQTALEQVHAALMPAGGFDVFGSLAQFERRYVRKEISREMTRSGRVYTKEIVVGYKNGDHLRERLAPMYLRRRYEDLTDVRMPVLMPPENVWLELHPDQRAKYEELRQGVLRLKTEHGDQVKHAEAFAKVTYGQQICAGLPALGEPDGPRASVKLDWLMHHVLHVWPDRKIVVFIKNLGLVRAAEQRLVRRGVGVARIWGQNKSGAEREAERERFWTDPNCRVLLGTAALERSLNLQNANILVNVDSWMNFARMQQLAGRIRRAGSAHEHIWIFNLLARDTQEDHVPTVQSRRAAVAGYVWGEGTEMFQTLTPMELMSLITD